MFNIILPLWRQLSGGRTSVSTPPTTLGFRCMVCHRQYKVKGWLLRHARLKLHAQSSAPGAEFIWTLLSK